MLYTFYDVSLLPVTLPPHRRRCRRVLKRSRLEYDVHIPQPESYLFAEGGERRSETYLLQKQYCPLQSFIVT